ncbi:MAG: hypothetical protein QNL91_16970 [Candidatus Krumholzibacteria bacterium]|nr:hypothetical protein [Candidatus Krumholzibacteria bacterium]
MRTLLTLTVVGILVFVAGSAIAENQWAEPGQRTVYELKVPALASHGHATLKLSQMYLDIHRINLEATEDECNLLAELAAAQDDDLVQRLVYRLERLDTNRQIDVLKVRIHYARLEGRHDQAFRLRREILELMKSDITALM